MSDFLAVAIGVLLGVLVSIPISLVIVASTTQSQVRYLRELRRPDVTIERPTREIVVFDAEFRQVLP